MKTPIVGQYYVARTVNAADDRLINLYPEATPDGGKTGGFLTRCPGTELKLTVGDGPIRGMNVLNGVLYVASGSKLYSVNTLLQSTLLGTIYGETGIVSMANNGTQLFVACNGPSYIYDTSTSTFQRITDVDFPGAVTVGYLDEYFVFNEPNSQRLWVTAPLNGTSIDGLDFVYADSSPDLLVAVIVDHREAWLFGSNSVEVWYNANLPDFPLQQVQGAFLEVGCAAPYSPAKMDNSVFWLAQDARGYGIVYKATGYSPQRISTHAIEYEIQQYGDISDAVGYTYQQDGHFFYMLTFPTVSKTWCYDTSVGIWHERASFKNGEFYRHRSNCQAFFNNLTLVGDFENGNIYSMDSSIYDDNGNIQKWLRSWRALPTGMNDLKRSVQHSLQIDMETGIGLLEGQGSDPEVVLRFSDDGGHTWSYESARSIGAIGEYGKRVIWRRLGMTTKLRDRVYELSGTDPVKINILGAELDVEGTRA